jgi:phosphatidylglycerol lysyltransferase
VSTPPENHRTERGRWRSLPDGWPDWTYAVFEFTLALRPLAPFLLAAMVFAGGLVLLLSASAPAQNWRTALLRDVLPLPFAEASHLSASLAGLALIVLARGLALRMQQARIAAIAVLIAGAGFSVLKGLDWEDAAILLAVAGALILTRREFYRRGEWRSFRPTPVWTLLVVLTVLAAIAIGFLGYGNVATRGELWWQFAWHGDAPRFLRAALVLSVAVAALTLDALVNRPLRGKPQADPVPETVRRLIADCADSARQVALLGDKRFLIAPDDDAFLMYGRAGRSWVCLGGPVGAAAAGERLIWDFMVKTDRAGGRAVFYGIPADRIVSFLDLGQAIVKTGEVARVDLTGFSLDGPARKDLRYATGRAKRDGLTFEVLAKAKVPAELEALRDVSDAWLAARKGSEKGFSLGRFDPDYLAEFDLAVMRRDGRIVAFANLWRGAGTEMAIDLMRHLPGQSPVLMDALMTETMLYAQAQGCRWFSLGGAPLSGLADHPLAPLWARIGTLIYRRGDEFYSFEGLRAFKEKFGPVWSAQYMTCPGGLSVARALIDVALLISRPGGPATADEAGVSFSA